MFRFLGFAMAAWPMYTWYRNRRRNNDARATPEEMAP